MWIEVFKTGKHTDANSNSADYTADDISQIATKYNESVESYSSSVFLLYPSNVSVVTQRTRR
jgi:hypothetical protein